MLLQRTYLRFIEEEATAKRARAQIRPGDWSMVKRAVLRGHQTLAPRTQDSQRLKQKTKKILE